jgi:hypothetical protein
MGFQKSQPAESGRDAPSPAQKAHAHETHVKADNISSTCELPRPLGVLNRGFT